MRHLFLSATFIAASAIAAPSYCQAQSDQTITPAQLNQQLNQQLNGNTQQQPLQIIQQHQGVSTSSFRGLIDEMKGLVKDMVKVDTTSGDPKVHVKAPFVNVDVENGQSNVNINAPFVNVTKSGGNPASVKAPFTTVGGNNSAVPGSLSPGNVRVTAPFVNVDNRAGSNVNVNAPFANINSGQSGTQVQAPFTNVGSGSQSNQSDPNGSYTAP